MRGCSVSISLSFHKVCSGDQLLIICFPRINNLLKDIDKSYVTVWVYHDQYEDIFFKIISLFFTQICVQLSTFLIVANLSMC